MSVVDRLGREDCDLVAVHYDLSLTRILSSGLQPDFYVGSAPDHLQLVLLKNQAALDFQLWLADLGSVNCTFNTRPRTDDHHVWVSI